ncbi:MAG: hypothetical protein QNL11_12280, partial [Desulfobacterales bacterium]|nr:hypothetical protein [Desulfobacterales bacterium]
EKIRPLSYYAAILLPLIFDFILKDSLYNLLYVLAGAQQLHSHEIRQDLNQEIFPEAFSGALFPYRAEYFRTPSRPTPRPARV